MKAEATSGKKEEPEMALLPDRDEKLQTSDAVKAAAPDDNGLLAKADDTKSFKTEEKKPVKLDEEGVKIEVHAQCALDSAKNSGLGFKLEVKDEKSTTVKPESIPSLTQDVVVCHGGHKIGSSEDPSVDGPEGLGENAEAAAAPPADDTDDGRAITPDAGGRALSTVTAVIESHGSDHVGLIEDIQMATPEAEDRSSPCQLNATTATPAPQEIVIKYEPMDIDIEPAPPQHETPRPEKRRRMLAEAMDSVEVPFVPSLRKHADKERAAIAAERRVIDLQNLKQNHNDKVKKPKDAPGLEPDSIMARLTAHNIPSTPFQIDLEKDILDVAVRRGFMSGEYGGNSQDAYPSIGAAFVAKTGKDNFAYLNLVYNPHCPQVPGAPGLMFSLDYDFALELSDDEEEEEEEGGDDDRSDNGNQSGRENSAPGPSTKTKDDDKSEVKDIKKKVEKGMIVFARLDTNTWQYQGLYATREAPLLTAAEWKQQASNVRNIWTKNIADPAKDWGAYVRIPVALRRQLGRRPTEAEADAAKQAGGNFSLTPEEISTAIDRGEVVIWTKTMRCIGYDVAFQRDIAAKFALFVPPPRKPRAKKNKGAKPKGKGRTGVKTQTKPKSAAKAKAKAPGKSVAGQKRKRAELESDSEDDDDEPEYHPKGTRSRPNGA